MSVTAISRVWERSRAKGSELLVLLAIADYADDEGRNAWPSVQKLADKSRMTERGVRDVLRRLADDGELAVERNTDGREVAGGFRPRLFMHVLCCEKPEKFSGRAEKIADQPEKISGLKPEKISDQPEKISDRAEEFSEKTEPGRTRIKEDPSLIRQSTSSRAIDGRRPHPLDDEPRKLDAASLDAFERLWAIYPRQEARVPALRAWHALNPSRDVADFILAHVQMRVKAGWARDVEPRFLPLLRTFLEEARWQERYVPSKGRTSTELPEGLTLMAPCQTCGDTVEGRVVEGQRVYDECARCSPPAAQAGVM